LPAAPTANNHDQSMVSSTISLIANFTSAASRKRQADDTCRFVHHVSIGSRKRCEKLEKRKTRLRFWILKNAGKREK